MIVGDRNNVKYPSPYGISDYRIDLSETYRKCCKIELVYAFIPDSQYVINGNNNVLTISKSLNNNKPDLTNTVDIVIPKGDYNVILKVRYSIRDGDNNLYLDALSTA